ncbi:MAG: hypothetical protein ACTSVI_16410 [Promethearchaeota archaeon]
MVVASVSKTAPSVKLDMKEFGKFTKEKKGKNNNIIKSPIILADL